MKGNAVKDSRVRRNFVGNDLHVALRTATMQVGVERGATDSIRSGLRVPERSVGGGRALAVALVAPPDNDDAAVLDICRGDACRGGFGLR